MFDPLEKLITEVVDRVSVFDKLDDQARRRLIVESNQRSVEVMKEVVPLLGVALFSNVELGRRFFVERLAPLLEKCVAVTEKSMSGWDHRAVDPRIVMITAWGMQFGMALDAAIRDKELDTAKTTKQITDLLYHGLVHTPRPQSRKG